MDKFSKETLTKQDAMTLDIFGTLLLLEYIKKLEDNPTWE